MMRGDGGTTVRDAWGVGLSVDNEGRNVRSIATLSTSSTVVWLCRLEAVPPHRALPQIPACEPLRRRDQGTANHAGTDSDPDRHRRLWGQFRLRL
jgi:hypothetical protein